MSVPQNGEHTGRGILQIGAPYLDRGADTVRLCSRIVCSDRDPMTIYYEFDAKYESYLCPERADSFLIGLFRYAMFHNCDIVCEQAVTDTLFYNFTQYLIPIVSQNLPEFKRIHIQAPLAPPLTPLFSGVGTGFSAGVDSFYTIFKNLREAPPRLRLTHLFFVNVGALTHDPENAERIFKKKQAFLQPCADELKLELVGVNTNFLQFYENKRANKPILNGDATKVGSCVYAVQKLIGTYLFAAFVHAGDFCFSSANPGYYDMLTVDLISSQGLRFYSSGLEIETRIRKIDYIGGEPLVQKYLSVCSDFNCNQCMKCLGTSLELYALDKLQLYSAVFDTNTFYEKKITSIGKALLGGADGVYPTRSTRKIFRREINVAAKEHDVKIPMTSRLYARLYYIPKNDIYMKVRENRFFRFLYEHSIKPRLSR